MAKIKKFLVFTFFSLFFSAFAGKVVQAYTLTLKPKFHCGENEILIRGKCVEDVIAS